MPSDIFMASFLSTLLVRTLPSFPGRITLCGQQADQPISPQRAAMEENVLPCGFNPSPGSSPTGLISLRGSDAHPGAGRGGLPTRPQARHRARAPTPGKGK